MKKPLLTLVWTIALTACAFGQTAVSPTINDTPSREFGAPALLSPINNINPNFVEGRELYQPASIAFDFSANPPILYVADTFNNRILAFTNPNNVTPCGLSAPTCGFANLVIGPRPGDFQTTIQGGPGGQAGQLSTGLYLPTAVAVDGSGNLYVADYGNNRVVRFPAPFKQTSALWTVDLVIGQKTASSSGAPNQGQQLPTNQTLNFSGGQFGAGIAIEPVTGNLWVADAGNNRVLRFPASQLVANTTLPTADVVLGQNAFNTNTVPSSGNTQAILYKGSLNQPTGIVFDNSGNLYVSDSLGRVMFYLSGGFSIGLNASRILGVCEPFVAPQTSASCSVANQYTVYPGGLFTDGTHVFVTDLEYNRIAEYDVPANWPAPPNPGTVPQTAQDSPPIMTVIGQNGPTDFTDGKANKGQPEADSSTLQLPRGGAFNGTDLWIADYGNNRVLGFQLQNGIYNAASRLVGQLDYPYMQPNLIEGRELFVTLNNVVGGDVAVDHSSTPPHLYIADTYNNRILGFNNGLSVVPGQKADIVIGQSDISGKPGSAFYRGLSNNPKNDPTIAVQTGLSRPTGVIVDSAGNLFVADSGNGRVLRFPTPFTQTSGTQQLPTLVLGQTDYNSQQLAASQQNMSAPYGLALFSDGSLAVSDPALNRILIFKKPKGGDFQSAALATTVLGQNTFNNASASATDQGLSAPLKLGVDTSDRLYVADSANYRMVVYNNTLNATNGAASAFQLTLPAPPQGVVVNSYTGEIWLGLGTALWRLPEFGTLELDTNLSAPYTQQLLLQTTPFAVTLDDNFNPIVVDASNRATFFFPKLTYQNSANFNGGDGNGNYFQGLAPGQLATLYQFPVPFNFTPASATTNPWTTTLSGIQVTVNGVAAPLYSVGSSYIGLQIPSATPTSGTVPFLVTQVSTGAILAAGSIPMAQYNPGFFATNEQGTGQIAARNPDGSINSPSNPVCRGSSSCYITFYLTGGGVFTGGPNPPPQDGYAPTPGQQSATADIPQMLQSSFGPNALAPNSDLLYSGAGAFAGGYQINWLVDTLIPPSSSTGGMTVVTVRLNGIASNVGPNNSKPQLWFYTK